MDVPVRRLGFCAVSCMSFRRQVMRISSIRQKSRQVDWWTEQAIYLEPAWSKARQPSSRNHDTRSLRADDSPPSRWARRLQSLPPERPQTLEAPMNALVKHGPLVARILFGTTLLVFGLNGFLQFLPTPPPPPHAAAFFG